MHLPYGVGMLGSKLFSSILEVDDVAVSWATGVFGVFGVLVAGAALLLEARAAGTVTGRIWFRGLVRSNVESYTSKSPW